MTITPASGSQIANLPQSQHIDVKGCAYSTTAENKNGSLFVSRNLTVRMFLMDPKSYGVLHNFFQAVRNGDDQQVVLASAAGSH